MGMLESWAKFCAENNTLVYLLEEHNGIKLFETKSRYECNHNYYYDNPVYQIWDGDDRVLAIENYQNAYQIYRRMIEA